MKEEKRDEEDESIPRDQEEVESPRNKTINLEEKISELEAGMKCLQEKVTRLEEENKKLKAEEKAFDASKVNNKEKEYDNEKESLVTEHGGFWTLETELIPPKKSSRRAAYRCIECSVEFVYENNLNDHVQTHTSESEVLNQNKNSGFKRSGPQVQSEANRKVFHCEICSKDFESKNILNVHMLIHSEYKCKKCDVNFETKQKFEEHQRKDHVNEIVDQP